MNRSIYFPNDLEKEIVKKAKEKKVSISQFVCEQLKKIMKGKKENDGRSNFCG